MTTQTVAYKAYSFQLRNLAFFFLITLGLSWGKQALRFFDVLKPASGITDPVILVNNLAAWGPTLAAFVVTALTAGKPGVSALWKRFWNRSLSLKWLIVILLFIPALWLVTNLVSRTVDGQAYRLFDQPEMFLGAFIGGVFTGLSEEFGWRGYALPRFQVKWNALVSSLILGVIWMSWHTQFFTQVILNPLRGIPIPPDVWGWGVFIVTCSVFITWIFNNILGNILGAVLFHTLMNAGAVIFWCCGKSWYWPAVLVVAAVVIVAIFGPKNLMRRRPEAEAISEKVRAAGA